MTANLQNLTHTTLPHPAAVVRGQAIPEDRSFAGDVSAPVPEQDDDVRGLDAAGKELAVEMPKGDAGVGRQTLPVEGVLPDRSLAQGHTPMGPQRKAWSRGYRVQAGLALSPARISEAGLALARPVFIPAPRRFAGDAAAAGDFGRAEARIKELGGLETAPFQRREVPFAPFGLPTPGTIA